MNPTQLADHASSSLPLKNQLSLRVLALLLAALAVGLMAIGFTLFLSWQLEGGGAAINAAGSLRMRAYRMGLTLEHYASSRDPALADQLRREEGDYRETLALLRQGDPVRPLYLPDDEQVLQRFTDIETNFEQLARTRLDPVLAGQPVEDWRVIRNDFDRFVEQIDQLVLSIEQFNTRRTLYLRLSQMFLIALAIVGAVTQIYLMFLLIFRPLARLRGGITRMAEKDFTVRLPVESRDEFGEVQQGFNHMADRLADAYGSLERRVEEKTAELNAQNLELALLYDVAAFVNGSHAAPAMCRGALERLVQWFGADAGSVRVIDPSNDSNWLISSIGVPETLRDAAVCRHAQDCLCGPAQQGGTVIELLRELPPAEALPCRQAGFMQVSAFPIGAGDMHVGVITLFFSRRRTITEQEKQLLTTLGQHLGIALENLRLAARDRELAVSEERNLMAQGLHDSIAQGLSFLNLQVQMLDDSLARGAMNEARDIVPLLRAGVTESYEDVRELLLNFRTRLQEGDLIGAMRTAVDKFRKQTGISTSMTINGQMHPLPSDVQLQLLFILQEVLSNVRKHSGATRVEVSLHDGDSLRLEIKDNGRGFDEAEMARRAERHVGLNIMRERAARVGAQLEFINDNGVTVVLTMARPASETAQEEQHAEQYVSDDSRSAG